MLLPTAALHVSKLTFPSETIVVNTECSMLGEGLFPLTPADRALNAASDNPGFQPFEQLISGRYLGEIARLTLEAAGEKVGGRFSLESEETGEAGTFKSRVVAAVGTRAAAFLAAMVAALWELGGGGDEVVVACAGAVVEGRVLGECQGFLDGLVGEGRVRLVVVRDAGLVGAAVAAVEAQREGRASKSRL